MIRYDYSYYFHLPTDDRIGHRPLRRFTTHHGPPTIGRPLLHGGLERRRGADGDLPPQVGLRQYHTRRQGYTTAAVELSARAQVVHQALDGECDTEADQGDVNGTPRSAAKRHRPFHTALLIYPCTYDAMLSRYATTTKEALLTPWVVPTRSDCKQNAKLTRLMQMR
jgi:hypothetical protein